MAGSPKSVVPALSPRARYWRRLIAECAKSGLTQAAFCAARGLSPGTMSWWRGELRFRDRNAARGRGPRPARKPGVARFVAVTVRSAGASMSPPSPIEIVLAGDRVAVDFGALPLRRDIENVEYASDVILNVNVAQSVTCPPHR